MKKGNLTAIIIASSMMLTLAGCGVTAEPDSGNSNGSEVSVSSEAEAPEAEGTGVIENKPSTSDGNDAAFEYNGKTVSFTDSFDTIKSALGVAMLIVYIPFILDMLIYTNEGAILDPVRKLFGVG